MVGGGSGPAGGSWMVGGVGSTGGVGGGVIGGLGGGVGGGCVPPGRSRSSLVGFGFRSPSGRGASSPTPPDVVGASGGGVVDETGSPLSSSPSSSFASSAERGVQG